MKSDILTEGCNVRVTVKLYLSSEAGDQGLLNAVMTSLAH